jgi:hypothetical protein
MHKYLLNLIVLFLSVQINLSYAQESSSVADKADVRIIQKYLSGTWHREDNPRWQFTFTPQEGNAGFCTRSNGYRVQYRLTKKYNKAGMIWMLFLKESRDVAAGIAVLDKNGLILVSGNYLLGGYRKNK